MIRTILTALVCSCALSASAQKADDKNTFKTSSTEVYTMVDQQPVFPGDLRQYLSEKIIYPQQARDSNVQGKVVVRFIVDEKGAVVSPTILRSAGSALDSEALRVISAMPMWKPGAINGVAVKSYFNLPVNFKLR